MGGTSRQEAQERLLGGGGICTRDRCREEEKGTAQWGQSRARYEQVSSGAVSAGGYEAEPGARGCA